MIIKNATNVKTGLAQIVELLRNSYTVHVAYYDSQENYCAVGAAGSVGLQGMHGHYLCPTMATEDLVRELFYAIPRTLRDKYARNAFIRSQPGVHRAHEVRHDAVVLFNDEHERSEVIALAERALTKRT